MILPYLIVIEGVIGAGKSTLAGELSQLFGFKAFYEKVKECPHLDAFYADPAGTATLIQHWFLTSRVWTQEEAQKWVWQNLSCAVLDRSIHGDTAFARLGVDAGWITKGAYESYASHRDFMLSRVLAPHFLFYLELNHDVAMSRIATRGRECEKGIEKSYIADLDEQYQVVLDTVTRTPTRVVRLDGELPAEDNAQRIYNILTEAFSG